jgi:diguanylate cyclase (GGDEF)-like protein
MGEAGTLPPPGAGARAAVPASPPSPQALEQVVAAFPGPALLADRAGRVVTANPRAGSLRAAIEEGVVPDLALALARAVASGQSQTLTATLPAHLGGGALKLTLIAEGMGDGGGAQWVAVLANDESLETNLRAALIESRQRYKDLVECSADFAWETGSDGCFVFVSPGGILGYHPDELLGCPARNLVCSGIPATDPLPFGSRERVDDMELWLRGAGGGDVCYRISSVPLFGPNGVWTGARGVGRDVTANRASDLLLVKARRREQTLEAVARATRSEVEPQAMLDAASRAIAEALDLRACWVLRLDADRRPYAAASWPRGHALSEGPLAKLGAIVASGVRDANHTVEADGAILVPALHAQAINGALAAQRAAAGWDIEDRDLLTAVAGQIAIVIEQAAIHERLEVMSRTDPLTGLLNRRGFVAEASRRLRHAARTRRSASVLYIDLNRFKAINDAFGHGAGDQTLRIVGHVLDGSGRGGDVPARFGGDEFVLWLDETDIEGARTRAEKLIETFAGRQDIPRIPGRRFGVAIGVAASEPASGEDLASLLERADRAMFQAKRADAASAVHLAPARAGVSAAP